MHDKNVLFSGPQNNCKLTIQSRTRIKNSLFGPPKSIRLSEIPESSVNLTETLLSREKDFLISSLKAPSQRWLWLILKFDIWSSLILRVVLVSLVMTSLSLFETLEDHLLPQGHFLLQIHYCIAKCQGLRRHKADLHHWWNWDNRHMLQNVHMCEKH